MARTYILVRGHFCGALWMSPSLNQTSDKMTYLWTVRCYVKSCWKHRNDNDKVSCTLKAQSVVGVPMWRSKIQTHEKAHEGQRQGCYSKIFNNQYGQISTNQKRLRPLCQTRDRKLCGAVGKSFGFWIRGGAPWGSSCFLTRTGVLQHLHHLHGCWCILVEWMSLGLRLQWVMEYGKGQSYSRSVSEEQGSEE